MDFLKDKFKYENNLVLTGMTDELKIIYTVNLLKEYKEDVIVVTNSLYEATKLYNKFLTHTEDVVLFPMDDYLTSVLAVKSPELKFTRLETLNILSKGSNKIIVTNLMGYLKKLNSKSSNISLVIKQGESFNRKDLIEKLDSLGYVKESLVTSTSEYSVRGMIIDIYPIYYSEPIRIEFDGNEIESIKKFNEETQISYDDLKSCEISPVNEDNNNMSSSLLDYTSSRNVIFIEEQQIEVGYKKLQEDIFNYSLTHKNTENFLHNKNELSCNKYICINELSTLGTLCYGAKTIFNYNGDFDKLRNDFSNYLKNKKTVIFYLSKDFQINKIRELIPTAKIIKKKLNEGFVIDNYVVISEFDIEKQIESKTKYKSTFKFGKKIKSYDSLEIGDYVVHLDNGVGIYNGIQKITKNGLEKDYIQILYYGDDKVYVPVEKISTIYKYGDKDGSNPTISKLNGTSWKKTRLYIQNHVRDISAELINLYKKRLQVKSDIFKTYFNEEEVFDKSFQYDLTKDQNKCKNEILKDLNSDHPMDRLLCGDVGFGKTEVAFRGIFNTVLNNKQVMYLCPTTILSQQQYNVAVNRLKDWPIEIALLNRFVTLKETKNIIQRFKEGKIDILFGTHRILSDDIIAKDLGLLVVDEEQRFGVTHKEKIKNLKNNINVLTLSATPIPRTLKMAISGIRDLSIIDTAPVNRYPIQTYVLPEQQYVIKDAIYKELSRNGQVFILYNRVSSIESFSNKIQKLIPDAKVSYAHGQMGKEELEDIMNRFIENEFDVLICTTIIESGIDIPNVNTLLVMNADRFGLSQLYQIRGRVGRSDKIAYAYLFYEENKILTEVATKRLKAIKDFTELGSGYKIAMRDLAIRGAGDIFGSSQAGFVDAVGISLYMKLIEDEVKRQNGEEVEKEEINQVYFDVETHINDDYVSDEDIKIEIHKLINEVDSHSKFEDVSNILTNRFGKIPESLKIYMYEEWFEKLALSLKINKVHKSNLVAEVYLGEEISSKIKGDKLLMLTYSVNKKFNIKYFNKQIIISLPYKNLEKHFLIYFVELFELIINDCIISD